MTIKGKIMTNDNIHVTNAQVAEATALPFVVLDEELNPEFFDKEGNVIPFDLEDTFSQADEDVKLDVSNTSH